MTEKLVYMIKRTSDGLFSSGGCSPHFSQKGKCWTHIGHLKNHLNLFIGYKGNPEFYPYRDCEVVTYRKVVIENVEVSAKVDDLFLEIVERVQKDYLEYQERSMKEKEFEERRQLEDLKRKYEDEGKNPL